MKNNFLSLKGMRLKGRRMNDPEITRKSRGNHAVITRFSRLITSTLLLLFTFAIGQMWGAPQSVTFGTAVDTKGYVYSSSTVADATLLTDKCVYYSSAKNTVSLSSGKIIAYRLSLIFRLNASANVDAVIGKNKNKDVSYVLYSLTSTQYDFIKGMSGESNDVATAYVALANDHPMKTLFKDAGISANDASRQKLLSAVDVADVTTKLYTSDSYATSTSEVTTIPIWKAATGTNKNVLNAGYYAIYIDCGSSSGNTLDNLTFTAASSCTEAPAAPTAFSNTAVTANTATFSITDGADAASYDLYYAAGSPTAPTSGTTATTNVTTKTPTIESLSASTTYKIWVRSVCDADHKSGWVALGGGGTFTTSAACTVAPTVSTITKGTTSYTTQVMNCAGITSLGSAGCAISSYGFVYGTSANPNIDDDTPVEVGTSYTVVETAFAETTLTGLTPNTTYYVRAYATNDFGTAYSSNELSFTTLPTIGNVAFIASSSSVTNDAITALQGAGYNVTVRAKEASPDYTGVDLVVLDESLSWANSDEGATVVGVNVPILNLKAFFYTLSSRWNWGTPVNPSTSELATLSTEYTNISSHPIFDGVTITAGAVDMVNPSKSGNNLQGVTTSTLVEGKRGYTLATSATGTTCIHELTPSQRGVSTAKYLLIALSSNIKDNYSDDAKKMIVNAAKYLIGNTAWVPVIAPTLSSSVPANNATDVAVEGNIVLTFSQNVSVLDASKFTLTGGAGTLNTAGITVSDAVVTIPYSGLANSTTYTLATAAGAVKNAGDVPNAALSNIEFTTEAACTKPGTPANLTASNLAYTTADLSWDAAANSDGYKISIIKKDDESVILDWTDNATTSYAATGLTQGTEYTFKVKAKGVSGYCEFGLEATVDFTTTAPSVADLVTIADDYTFTPSAAIAAGTITADNKFFAAGTGDCDISGGKMRVKTNRALAFKVADGAKIKVTFTENGSRQIQLGTALSEGNYDTYGYSTKSPYTFNVVSTGGVVYLTAQTDQLYFSKLEITYPHTVTYDLNGGTGTTPTESAYYAGEIFTAHDGVTDITAPATKEFEKWVDQDAADVAASAEYTMPAKNVTLTASWRTITVKYTVTYDLNGYSAEAPTETPKAENDVFAIKAAPARAGYEFLGWVCDIDAQTYQATDDYTMTAANTTFTAQWQDESEIIKLINKSTGAINTTNFTTAVAAEADVDGEKGAVFNANRDAISSVSALNEMVQYNATTTQTKIQLVMYNTSSAEKTIHLFKVAEGDDAATLIDITIDGNSRKTTEYYTFNSDKNRSFYITVSDKKVQILQMRVVESGTALKQFGQAGYSLNLNKGRIFAKSGNAVNFEGATVTVNSDYKVLNNSNLSTNSYIQFNNAVANTTLKVTRSGGNYYVSQDPEDKGTSYNKNEEIVLSATGTWYLGSTSSGSSASFTKIEFIAPKCAEPTITPMSNSDLCEGDPFAALAVSATVGDGGTLHYQWYKHPAEGDDEAVGTDAASYTPEADGQYYVVVTNQLAGYSDNSATSNTITVTHFAAAVITTAPLNQRGEVDDVVTLTVAASGKNVAYEWFTCDNAAGDNPVAVVPAATGTTLNVTVTASMEQWYKVLVTSDCGSAFATAKVSEFVPTTPANVTNSILWDWKSTEAGFPTATTTMSFTNTSVEELFADVDAAMPNNEYFRSDMLYGIGQIAWRNTGDGEWGFQGYQIRFKTEVAGKVRVYYRTPSSGQTSTLTIDGKPAGSRGNSWGWSEYVEVNANTTDGIIISMSNSAGADKFTRVQKIEFLALAHQRTTGYAAGDLGTVCLEDATIIEGAKLYELAGLDQYGYLAFDQILSGELEAGKPYLFEVTNPSNISFYKPVGADHSDTEIANKGMIGTFTGTTLNQGAEDYYYFSGRHIWKVNDFTVGVPIPAHRCYVDMDVLKTAVAPATPAPGRVRMTIGVNGKNTPTAIDNAEASDKPAKMLINGQLFILRGDKTYDVTGKLVK